MCISNIFIDQGATFTTTVTVTDANDSAVNLSGYSVPTQIRKVINRLVLLLLLHLYQMHLREITISLTPTQTTALEQGRYVYDVLITQDLVVQKQE